jgi:fumarate hydratase class II
VTGSRIERDALGPIAVPADRYWGAQTQRSLELFRGGGERLPPELIHALGLVKQACAEANLRLGVLPAAIAGAIVRAAEEVRRGQLDEHFPLVIWQTGSGTQSNMNANEVIANRASELLGAPRGGKHPVHPNDHVNRSQSSNDVFPTAMHVAVLEALGTRLVPAVRALRDTLRDKAIAHAGVIKIGRTHLQDAVPITLGQEISGWASQLDQGLRHLESTKDPLHELAIGATAVGTGLNAPAGFGELAARRIAELTGRPFVVAANPFAALAAHDAVVGTHGALRVLAGALTKIAGDVALLASGPRSGLGEITVPENEPGSSIMPGKVNPTQAEALLMVCAQVQGNDVAVGIGGAAGRLELNVFKPMLAHNALRSIRLLADAVEGFDRHCARGLEPDRARIHELLDRSLMLATALVPRLGYDRAAAIARRAHTERSSLRDAAVASGDLTGEEFDRLVRPETMVFRPETTGADPGDGGHPGSPRQT